MDFSIVSSVKMINIFSDFKGTLSALKLKKRLSDYCIKSVYSGIII